MKKPIVLWTCDTPGWAYHNRIVRLRKAMPQYEFRIWYFGGTMTREARTRELAEADIIVCQGVSRLRIVNMMRVRLDAGENQQAILDARYNKGISRLDSLRVDDNGKYIDIFGDGSVCE